MSALWYALRSKPRKEEVVSKQARDQGFEVFFPRLKVHTVNPRARAIQPYFPGYLFVRADIDAVGMSIFQWMPHSVGLVCFGGEPAPVPDNLVHAIRQRVVVQHTQKRNDPGTARRELARAVPLQRAARCNHRDLTSLHSGATREKPVPRSLFLPLPPPGDLD